MNVLDRYQIQKKCLQGTRNRLQGLDCQDAIADYFCNGCQAVSIADGTGMDSYAAKGAELTAKVISQLLAQEYERLFNSLQIGPQYVQHNVIENILRNQRLVFPSANKEQLQSTTLAVAVNLENNTYIYIHLGDGWIYYNKNGEILCLSEPENGFAENETYLTSTPKATEHIRCGRGILSGISEFTLTTDGVGKKIFFEEELDGLIDSNEKEARLDDMSICRLRWNKQ